MNNYLTIPGRPDSTSAMQNSRHSNLLHPTHHLQQYCRLGGPAQIINAMCTHMLAHRSKRPGAHHSGPISPAAGPSARVCCLTIQCNKQPGNMRMMLWAAAAVLGIDVSWRPNRPPFQVFKCVSKRPRHAWCHQTLNRDGHCSLALPAEQIAS